MPNPASAGLPNPVVYDPGSDGTVTDRVSGLVWERSAQSRSYDRDAAFAFCAANRRGGYSDWRLPSRLELLSIVDFTRSRPSIDTSAFEATVPPAPMTTDTFLWYTWTSSTRGPTAGGFMLDFTNGHLNSNIFQNLGQVRCTRSPIVGHCYLKRFQPQPGDQVYDASTSLIWQRTVDPRSFTWAEAVAYCASLGGGSRLPSIKELETILDVDVQYPSIDVTAFPDTPSEYFWASSRWSAVPTYAWTVGFNYSDSNGTLDSQLMRARCVR